MRTDLVDTPGNPVPEQANMRQLGTADGVGLRVAQWPASAMPIWGTVLLLQGRAEFIEKYFETVGHFRARGFDVMSFDWRGQGGSERLPRNPRKGHVREFSDYHLDLDAVFAEMGAGSSPKPWFVVAHSMGAAVFLARLGRGQTPVTARRADLADDRLLADNRASVYGRARHHAFRLRLGAHASFQAAALARSSQCPSRTIACPRIAPVMSAMRQSCLPRRISGSALRPSIGLASACQMMRALSDPNFPRKIATPLLIVASGDERVVSTQATERFASRLKTGSAIVIIGARHELLMESDFFRDQALAAIDAFLPGGELHPGDGDDDRLGVTVRGLRA